jgi:hypothetical protein
VPTVGVGTAVPTLCVAAPGRNGTPSVPAAVPTPSVGMRFSTERDKARNTEGKTVPFSDPGPDSAALGTVPA